MREVKVRKDWLTKVLLENMAGHKAEYEKAFAGYQKEAVEVLEKNIELIRSGHKKRIYFGEVAPEDHTEDYQLVLDMLANSTEGEVVITDDDYRQYVNNDWGWRQQWTASNSKYLTK